MFILTLYRYITGYVKLKITGKNAEKFVNQLIRAQITFWNMRKETEDSIILSLSSKFVRENELQRFSEFSGAEYTIKKYVGIRYLFEKHKFRLGIYTGVILGLLTLFISTFFVWDIKVTASDYGKNDEILKILNNLGLKNGSYIPSLKIDEIKNKVLFTEDDIKWIALNIRGTVVNVEIKKRDKPIKIEDKESPMNIVAKKAGKIISVDTYDGQQIAAEGNTIEKGDLLISGIMDSNSIGLRVAHAAGKVIAETTKTIEVKIPLRQTEKIYTGEKEDKISLSFLSRNFNLFLSEKVKYHKFDKTYNSDKLTIFDVIKIPIYINSEIYTEFDYKSIIIDKNEAKNLATKKIDDIINNEFKEYEIEIIAKEYEENIDDDYFYLTCKLHCKEDISKEAPFESNIKK